MCKTPKNCINSILCVKAIFSFFIFNKPSLYVFSGFLFCIFFFFSLFKLIIFNIKIIRARAEPLQPINKFKKKEKK